MVNIYIEVHLDVFRGKKLAAKKKAKTSRTTKKKKR